MNDRLQELAQSVQQAAQQRWQQRRRLPRQIIPPDSPAARAQWQQRRSVVHPNDGLALERILGSSDLLSINYLAVGLKVAQAVCRLQLRDPSGRALGFGTGFLVSPHLLLTNHHVIPSAEYCQRSLAEFNFEEDENYLPRPVSLFSLQPERFFYTSPSLDFSLVAVASTALDGTSLERFGFLRLHPQPGKILPNEYVSIIQHPQGASKQVTLRENQVCDLFDDYIHYTTDTQPGSSGSPVFNDQWVVVALHHAGVQAYDDAGRPLSLSGAPWTPEMGADQIQWIANEGIRISSLCQHLQAVLPDLSPEPRSLLSEVLSAYQEDRLVPRPTLTLLTTTLGRESYDDRQGYDPDFLGRRVPLPRLPARLRKDCVPLLDGSGVELKYTHFSIVLSQSRRLAYFTAVNIDGAALKAMPRASDRWYFDPRIERRFQLGPELYEDNALDRGHLVRRLDPVWGEAAAQANEDTFHFTNCSPQHQALNRTTWNDLEEYVLRSALAHQLRVIVFTGPVFRLDDMPYRDLVQIPAEFWKVVVIRLADGRLSATAYLQSQKNLLRDLEFAYGAYRTYQVTVRQIETLTGLSFGRLRNYDPLARPISPTPPTEAQPPATFALPLRLIEGADQLLLS